MRCLLNQPTTRRFRDHEWIQFYGNVRKRIIDYKSNDKQFTSLYETRKKGLKN